MPGPLFIRLRARLRRTMAMAQRQHGMNVQRLLASAGCSARVVIMVESPNRAGRLSHSSRAVDSAHLHAVGSTAYSERVGGCAGAGVI